MLVIAADRERRDWIARQLAARGVETAGCHPRRASLAVRELRPAGLAVDVADAAAARRVLARARAAAEAPLPALLLVRGDTVWAHTSLPPELLPAVTLDRAASGRAFATALRALGLAATPGPVEAAAGYSAASTAWGASGDRRLLAGSLGSARLTPSEARLYEVLVEQAGDDVPAALLGRAVWGDAHLDAHRRSALRAHIYELRHKLRAAGVPAVLRAHPGAGYRLSLVTAPLEPPGGGERAGSG